MKVRIKSLTDTEVLAFVDDGDDTRVRALLTPKGSHNWRCDVHGSADTPQCPHTVAVLDRLSGLRKTAAPVAAPQPAGSDLVGMRLEIIALVEALRSEDNERIRNVLSNSEFPAWQRLLGAAQLLDFVFREFDDEPFCDLDTQRRLIVGVGTPDDEDDDQ